MNTEKINEAVEALCDLIILEAKKEKIESSKNIKELADALVLIINARASSEKHRIND